MKYKFVIFDLDGTLLNTLEDIAVSFNRVLRKKGMATYSMDAYRYFVGSGAREMVVRVLPPARRDDELIDDCIEAFQVEYRRSWNIRTRPYDGVPELLAALSERGIRVSVLSNKPHEFTVLSVREYFSGYDFAEVLGEGGRIPLKPDPTGALEIARRLGTPPGEFLYVGDTGVDMKTAVRAGMFPLGVLWGFRPEKELVVSGVREIVDCPGDILKFIDKPE
ncbi:MAG: HAD family hydrolase [Candidatus Auribacterota bacterium]|nr:HAD family hydrolase [Candidatus Auribacterota bacterium]